MAEARTLIVPALFWLLVIGVTFLPFRWSLLAYLAVIHFDLSGPDWAAASAVGAANSVKIVLLPAILLARTRFQALSYSRSWPFRLWMALALYAGLATLWSPFPLAGLKMTAYLISYGVVFLVFAYAWQRGLLDLRLVVAGLWIGLGLAVLQSYLLGNIFGSPPVYIIENARFTSFSSPQSFAVFLIAIGSLILFRGARDASTRRRALLTLSGAAILGGLILTGSRYALAGFTVMLGVAWLFALLTRPTRRDRLRLLIPAALAVVVLTGSLAVVAEVSPHNRLLQVVDLVAKGDFNLEEIGTFKWRTLLYQAAIDGIEHRDATHLIAGTGTSSGALVLRQTNPASFDPAQIDANRIVHSEFLRVVYEWGIIGGLLFAGFLIALLIGVAHRSLTSSDRTIWAFWGLLPVLLLSLAIENVLAGSGSPVGTGFALVISYVAAAPQPVWSAAPEALSRWRLRPRLRPFGAE